jgi:hypothetical protein
MFAMWRAGRVNSVLLAISLMSAIACPAAWASPEGESVQQYGQPPLWESCERFVGATGTVPTAQCGTVSVPVDYANPEGAQAQLAVIRIPASGDRIGVLVVNPGGPGASAVDTVASMGASLADTDTIASSTELNLPARRHMANMFAWVTAAGLRLGYKGDLAVIERLARR